MQRVAAVHALQQGGKAGFSGAAVPVNGEHNRAGPAFEQLVGQREYGQEMAETAFHNPVCGPVGRAVLLAVAGGGKAVFPLAGQVCVQLGCGKARRAARRRGADSAELFRRPSLPPRRAAPSGRKAGSGLRGKGACFGARRDIRGTARPRWARARRRRRARRGAPFQPEQAGRLVRHHVPAAEFALVGELIRVLGTHEGIGRQMGGKYVRKRIVPYIQKRSSLLMDHCAAARGARRRGVTACPAPRSPGRTAQARCGPALPSPRG